MEELSLEEEHQKDNSQRKQPAEIKFDAESTKTNNESSVRLCLRLPSGKKETISMCATDTIEDFLNKMGDMGYAPSSHTYLVPFPRTNIGAISSETHLSDTILSPANTVFISKI